MSRATPIETLYNIRLTQIALVDFLRNLKIPSSSELTRKVADLKLVAFQDSNGEYTEGFLDLARPISRQKPIRFGYREEASATAINKLLGRFYSDLDVLYDACVELESRHIQELMRSLQKLEAYERRIDLATEQVNRMLILSDDTEGLLDVVGDDFRDSSKVSQDETTAKLDTETGTVILGTDTIEELRDIGLNFPDMLEEAIAVTTVPRPGLLGEAGASQDSRLNILADIENPWLYSVSAETDAPTGIEIIIDFMGPSSRFSNGVTANRISINPFSATNPLLILVQYSNDRESWSNLQVAEPLRRVSSNTAYIFPKVTFRYLRIFMSKESYDSNPRARQFFYNFGIRTIKLDHIRYAFQDESIIVSKKFLPKNTDGTAKQFTKAVLNSVCEEILPDTMIEYYISFLIANGDSHTETATQRIWPLSQADPSRPLLAEVGSLARVDSATKVMQTTTAAYRHQSDHFNKLLGSAGTDTPLEVTDSTTSVQIWRNVGNRDRFYKLRQPTGWNSEDGWVFDGSYYNTYILIDSTSVTTIDFGPKLWIDEVEVSGTVRLEQGVHHVRIAAENWHSLEGLTLVASFNEVSRQFRGEQRVQYGPTGLDDTISEAVVPLTVLDPLYPYNQKLLIEGLTYSADYSDIKVYTGVSRYAAFLMSEISPFDFAENTGKTDYSKFTKIKSIKNNTEKTSIMIKWNHLLDITPREDFIVASQQASGSLASGLRFKAILKTRDPKHTPLLDGYEIKIIE